MYFIIVVFILFVVLYRTFYFLYKPLLSAIICLSIVSCQRIQPKQSITTTDMPRYDDSPRGPSPYDRRDRHMKSPLLDRRGMRRDSPPMLSRLGSRDHLLPPYHHDDYPPPPPPRHSRNPESCFKILCVSNISNKYPDSTVRNELIREFNRFGEISVKLVYDKAVRLAYIYFNNYDEAREARYFFGKHRLILLDKEATIDPIYDRPSMSRKRSLSPEYGRGGSMRNMSPLSRRPQSSSMSRSSMNDRYQLSVSIFLYFFLFLTLYMRWGFSIRRETIVMVTTIIISALEILIIIRIR